MKDDLFPEVTRHRLAALTQSATLPSRVREQANRLLDRLSSAVRVVVLGPDGVGKSDLVCALVGEALGRSEDRPLVARHTSCDAPEIEGPQYSRFSDPALAGMEFVDVPFPADPRRQAALVGWALGQADVVIWCTQDFGAQEAPYWAGVPDQLKDHSFLVLTRARALMRRGEIDEAFSALKQVAEEEFHSLFVVETAPVRACLDRGAAVDAETDAQSGVAALRRALLELAQAGQRAWEDAALLLLDRFGRQAAEGTEVVTEPAETPDAPPPKPAPAGETLWSEGLRLIDTRAADIAVKEGTAEEVRAVLDHCLETCEEVAELVSDAAGHGPDFLRFKDDVTLAADKMLLIAMEDGAAAAADSVTILLQLRREFELRQAA